MLCPLVKKEYLPCFISQTKPNRTEADRIRAACPALSAAYMHMGALGALGSRVGCRTLRQDGKAQTASWCLDKVIRLAAVAML